MATIFDNAKKCFLFSFRIILLVTRPFYIILNSIFIFLKDNELLEGMIFCFTLGVGFSSPFAVVWALSLPAAVSGALFALIAAMLGALVGGGFTLAAAWVQAEPQLAERHQRSTNAAQAMLEPLEDLESALVASVAFLGSATIPGVAFLVDPSPVSGRSLVDAFALTTLSKIELFEVDRNLSSALHGDLRRLKKVVSDLNTTLSAFVEHLRAWAKNRKPDVAKILNDRRLTLAANTAKTLKFVREMRERCANNSQRP